MSRYRSLDGLRGLAALSVFAYHSWRVTASQPPIWLTFPPIGVLWAGRQSVILFFVLSGFVLSLPFFDGKAPSYGRFALRRIFRLWPLFALATVAAAIAAVWLQGRPNVDHFPLASSGSVLVAYLPMISPYHYDTIDSPVWSLVHEMRFSLVFPLLVFAVTRLGRPRVTLALTFVIAIPALGALRFMPFGNNLPPPLNSLAYLPAFTAGILLAQNRQRLAAWYLSNGGAARLAFGAICLAIFAWPIPLYELWHPFLVLPCTALVLIALVEVCVSRLLTSRPAQFAGRISYSLYLSHTPILFVGMLTIGRILPGIAVVGLSWLVVVPLSTALYRWIELPIIAAGRRLTQAATST